MAFAVAWPFPYDQFSLLEKERVKERFLPKALQILVS